MYLRYVIYRNQMFIVVNNCRYRGNICTYTFLFFFFFFFFFHLARKTSDDLIDKRKRRSRTVPFASLSHTNSIFLNGTADSVGILDIVLVVGRCMRNGSSLSLSLSLSLSRSLS